MIFYLNGILKIKEADFFVIDVQGVGYKVFVAGNSPLYLKEEGVSVMVYTYHQVKEDDMSLFGFATKEELDLFKKLITVNSVGAKAAMAVLSSMPTEAVKKAIVFEDVAALTRANGIGKKTAQKIVLELKDKLESFDLGESSAVSSLESSPLQGEEALAVEALVNLGYGQGDAVMAVGNVIKRQEKDQLEIEEIIRLALKEI